MIELIATAESVEQGQQLILNGVDYIVIGEATYGLRLPYHFTFEEMEEMVRFAHEHNKQVIVAANAILHNEQLENAREYLSKLKSIGVDRLMVGDTGLIQIMKDPEYYIPFIYDASVLVTSPGQVDFWAKFGAVAAMVAREVPYVEMKEMVKATVPLVVQTYGAYCIHQSKRRLLTNYYNFVGKDATELEGRHLFLSEPKKEDTHYTITEDHHGTHVFADKDLNLMEHLTNLVEIGIRHWYLDGIYSPGENFVKIAKLFAEARDAIANGSWTADEAQVLSEKLLKLHPANREADTGFFLFDADQVQ